MVTTMYTKHLDKFLSNLKALQTSPGLKSDSAGVESTKCPAPFNAATPQNQVSIKGLGYGNIEPESLGMRNNTGNVTKLVATECEVLSPAIDTAGNVNDGYQKRLGINRAANRQVKAIGNSMSTIAAANGPYEMTGVPIAAMFNRIYDAYIMALEGFFPLQSRGTGCTRYRTLRSDEYHPLTHGDGLMTNVPDGMDIGAAGLFFTLMAAGGNGNFDFGKRNAVDGAYPVIDENDSTFARHALGRFITRSGFRDIVYIAHNFPGPNVRIGTGGACYTMHNITNLMRWMTAATGKEFKLEACMSGYITGRVFTGMAGVERDIDGFTIAETQRHGYLSRYDVSQNMYVNIGEDEPEYVVLQDDDLRSIPDDRRNLYDRRGQDFELNNIYMEPAIVVGTRLDERAVNLSSSIKSIIKRIEINPDAPMPEVRVEFDADRQDVEIHVGAYRGLATRQGNLRAGQQDFPGFSYRVSLHEDHPVPVRLRGIDDGFAYGRNEDDLIAGDWDLPFNDRGWAQIAALRGPGPADMDTSFSLDRSHMFVNSCGLYEKSLMVPAFSVPGAVQWLCGLAVLTPPEHAPVGMIFPEDEHSSMIVGNFAALKKHVDFIVNADKIGLCVNYCDQNLGKDFLKNISSVELRTNRNETTLSLDSTPFANFMCFAPLVFLRAFGDKDALGGFEVEGKYQADKRSPYVGFETIEERHVLECNIRKAMMLRPQNVIDVPNDDRPPLAQLVGPGASRGIAIFRIKSAAAVVDDKWKGKFYAPLALPNVAMGIRDTDIPCTLCITDATSALTSGMRNGCFYGIQGDIF